LPYCWRAAAVTNNEEQSIPSRHPFLAVNPPPPPLILLLLVFDPPPPPLVAVIISFFLGATIRCFDKSSGLHHPLAAAAAAAASRAMLLLLLLLLLLQSLQLHNILMIGDMMIMFDTSLIVPLIDSWPTISFYHVDIACYRVVSPT
jgi:hypothetical protein